MNIEIANALSVYLETLYEMNQRLIRLCGVDIMNDSDLGDKLVLDLIQDIPRVIPYSYNRKTKSLEYKEKDGLLEYKKEIPYIEASYDEILRVNYSFLENVRRLRNKYEHKMHGVRYCASSGGSDTLFHFVFEVSGETITVTGDEFVETMKKLNTLFAMLVDDVKQYAIGEGKDDHPYYNKLCKHDYLDFNRIYESDLLITVGRILKEY